MQISIKNKKQSMRKKLFRYMFILATVLLLIFTVFLYLFGQFTTTEDKISNILSLQTEFFYREMTAYYNDITLRGARLSEKTTQFTEQYFRDQNITFKDIENSFAHIDKLQDNYIDLLKEELLKVNCSGAFILLNVSQTGKSNSRAGIYINKDFFGTTDNESMLLFRGNVKTAMNKGIMPHRKWHMEFNLGDFPNFGEVLLDNTEPIEKASHICDIITLPGTSERAMIIALPIRGENGIVYGICGFEVSESIFKAIHAQPTTLQHIICIFSRSDDNIINIKEGLVCGTKNGYFVAPKENLKITSLKNGFVALKNKYGAYIGMTRKTTLYSEKVPYSITVMMPYLDYSKLETKNTLQLILIVLLSVLSILSLSLYFSKKFIIPIIQSLDKIKQSEKLQNNKTQSGIFEIDDLFAFLSKKDDEYKKSIDELSERNEHSQNEIKRIQTENKRLIKEHKNIITQDDYDYFCSGIRNLTPKERKIFELYLEGKTVQEIMQIMGVKESTLKYHNGNIYSKLGVSSKKQLLNFASIYIKNEGNNI